MAWKNKEAEKAYKKKYYQANKVRLDAINVESHKKWREENRDELKLRSKDYYWDNKEDCLKYQKKHKAVANGKSRIRTLLLTDSYMRKHLVKLSYPRDKIRAFPELLDIHRQIIKIKRKLK